MSSEALLLNPIPKLGLCKISYKITQQSPLSSQKKSTNSFSTLLEGLPCEDSLIQEQKNSEEIVYTMSQTVAAKILGEISFLVKDTYNCLKLKDEITLHEKIESDCIIMNHSKGLSLRCTWKEFIGRLAIFNVIPLKIDRVILNVTENYVVITVTEQLVKLSFPGFPHFSKSHFIVNFERVVSSVDRHEKTCNDKIFAVIQYEKSIPDIPGNLLPLLSLKHVASTLENNTIEDLKILPLGSFSQHEPNVRLEIRLVGKIKRIDYGI